MRTPGVALPTYRVVRRDRLASELEAGDYVHDGLTPFVVARFEDSPAHVVAVVGRLASGTDIGVRFLASTPLDVSRVILLAPPAPIVRRRHLSLLPPVGGAQ